MKNSEEIDGWFNYQELFDSLVQSVPDNGIFVECGAWLGKSSAYLCDLAKSRINIYIVDHWRGSANELDSTHKLATIQDIYPIFLENMGSRKFTPLRMSSLKASETFDDNSCDVVYIDMEHSYDAVKQDISYWLPKVKDGGTLAGHDYDWPGVKEAVLEMLGDEKNIITYKNSWIYKVNKNYAKNN